MASFSGIFEFNLSGMFSIWPDDKVRWYSRTLWLLLFSLAIYGGIDEFVQPISAGQGLYRLPRQFDRYSRRSVHFRFCVVLALTAGSMGDNNFWCGNPYKSRPVKSIADFRHRFPHTLLWRVYVCLGETDSSLYIAENNNRSILTADKSAFVPYVFVKISSLLLGRYFTIKEMLFSEEQSLLRRQ